MNTTEERKSILKMIEDDKITAAEGLQLLDALGEQALTQAKPSPTSTNNVKGRMFRVVVTNTNTGKIKTHVTLPMTLVNWGMKVGGHFAPEIEGVNLSELDQILQSTTHGKIIDVVDEEDGEHVEIFID